MNAKGLILLDGDASTIKKRGVKRIQDFSPVLVDIRHDEKPTDEVLAGYKWAVIIENESNIPDVKDKRLEVDAWEVMVSDSKPARVKIEGGCERAELYALYHIAACLEKGMQPSKWAVKRKPLIPRRYAWITAGNVWSTVCRPDWFDRDIVEIPEMGFNGVVLTCTPTDGTSIGRQTIPFTLTEHGVEVDRFKLPAFQNMFNWLKSYGLDICLFHQAFIPPPFTTEEVREYYNGQRTLNGFEDAIEKSSYDLAAAIFTHMPQVDSLLHHSIECEWMWGKAVSIFPCSNDEIAQRSFEAYLKGLSRACREYDKDLLFWTHVSGVTARQIKLMHKILARYPDVVLVEDHIWPNNSWPFAPVMGHLSKDIKSEAVKRRFGLSIDTTDGEYYGAGALPTAYPQPHIRAAKEAAACNAEYAYVRLNEQSLTPLGTLEDINTIHVLAVSEQWWQPARPTEILWKEWCDRRFGKKASPMIVSALKKSKIIIKKGLSASDIPFIDHSGLMSHSWKPNAGPNAFAVFDRPGELMVDKSYEELSGNREFHSWMVCARGVEFDNFLYNSEEAEEAAYKALEEIKSVREYLKTEDFEYLTQCFEDAILMIDAVRRTAVAAHALSVYLKEKSKVRQESLIESLAAMEVCADRIKNERGQDFRSLHFIFETKLDGKEYTGYGVPVAMRAIIEEYRKQIDTVLK